MLYAPRTVRGLKKICEMFSLNSSIRRSVYTYLDLSIFQATALTVYSSKHLDPALNLLLIISSTEAEGTRVDRVRVPGAVLVMLEAWCPKLKQISLVRIWANLSSSINCSSSTGGQAHPIIDQCLLF